MRLTRDLADSTEIRSAWVRWPARTAEPIDTTAKYGVAREAFAAGYEAAAESRDQRIKMLEGVVKAWEAQNSWLTRRLGRALLGEE